MAALIIDGESFESESACSLIEQLRGLALEAHHEIWVEYGSEDEARMMALISGDVGWLMFLRWVEDSGFSSRNVDYSGEKGAKLDFTLANGQVDPYPLEWCYPLETLRAAMIEVLESGRLPAGIRWYDDGEHEMVATAG